MEFIRLHNLLHKLVIIDGVGRSGKSLLADVIGYFDRVENQEYNTFLEFIAFAYHYKKMSADIAISILKTEMDSALYNSMIGRKINTRLSDLSSLYNYHTPAKYLRRAAEKDGPIVHERVVNEKPIYLSWSHDLVGKSDIIFEAYGNNLEFVYLNRRPIDIVYDWYGVNYSERMSKDPTEMQYCIKYKDTSVPVVAYGWEEEFLTCSPLERTLKLIYSFLKMNHTAIMKKHDYPNLHIITFEDLVTNPYREIERLKTILNSTPLPMMDAILTKGRCPRVLHEKDFQEKENTLLKDVSANYAHLLQEMNEMHFEIKSVSNAMEETA